jgi:hypothetical protein
MTIRIQLLKKLNEHKLSKKRCKHDKLRLRLMLPQLHKNRKKQTEKLERLLTLRNRESKRRQRLRRSV